VCRGDRVGEHAGDQLQPGRKTCDNAKPQANERTWGQHDKNPKGNGHQQQPNGKPGKCNDTGNGKFGNKKNLNKAKQKRLNQEEARREASAKRNRSGPYLLEDLKKKETGIAVEQLILLEQRLRGNALEQWKRYVNDASLPAQTGRKREAGFRTRGLYRERVITALKLLPKLGMSVGNLREFSVTHLKALYAHWEEHGASAATLQNMYTALFRLLVRLGKPNVPLLKDLLKDPTRAERNYVKEDEFTFEALGHDKFAFFKKVEAYCPITACQCRLMDAFYMRRKEAVMCHPLEADRGDHLWLTHGTKGGLPRAVPITTERQRELVEEAKKLSGGARKGVLKAHLDYNIQQALDHFNYVVGKKFGLNMKTMGMTPRGMRQGGIIRRYKTKTSGYDAPVTGGKLAPKEIHDRATREIAPEMGHRRTSVFASYGGSYHRENGKRNRYLKDVAAYFHDDEVSAQLRSAGITRLVLLEDAADGRKPDTGSVCAWEGHSSGNPAEDAQLMDLITRGVANAVVVVELTPELWAKSAARSFECF